MVRLHQQKHPALFGRQRKPPPNYFSRRVQLKILVLVFMFMGVLMLMDKARNPNNLRWMWHLGATSAQESNGAEAPSIDTRPPRHADPSDSTSEPTITGPDATVEPQSLLADDTSQSARNMQLDGWSRVLDQLGTAERQLFRVVLWNVRHGNGLDEAMLSRWEQVLQRLSENWNRYLQLTLSTVNSQFSPLTEVQKQQCETVVNACQSAWNELKPTLAAAAEPSQLTETQRKQLHDLQQLLDDRALEQIEDNTVLQRSAEYDAWFRWWEKLEALSPRRLQKADGPVTFVQLFSQSAEYRGRLVKVQGVARLAYHVRARNNPFGIKGYYVFWLRLNRNDQSPVAVYCLELPSGFPPIKDRDVDGQTTPLDESIEFTGFFFKRFAYLSHDGSNLAPLVLGKISRWQPPPPPTASKAMPSTYEILLGILAAAALGILIAIWAYRRGNWSPSDLPHVPAPPRELPSFEANNVKGGVSETLKEMTEDPDVKKRDNHELES